jgi:predicted ArsR family transcriptional regulator
MTAFQQLLQTTRGRILAMLRTAGGLTADDLATALGVTANAVRAQLVALERDGLVQQRSTRRGPRKPSFLFELTPSGERAFPARYELLLDAVLGAVSERADGGGPEELEQLFRAAGRRMAAAFAPRVGRGEHAARLADALVLLEELGGAAQVQEAPGDRGQSQRVQIVGASCPFGAVVPAYPQACAATEELLAGLLGATVRETCEKAPRARCRFEVEFGDGATAEAAPRT